LGRVPRLRRENSVMFGLTDFFVEIQNRTFSLITYNVLAPHLGMRRVFSSFSQARFLNSDYRFPLVETQILSLNPSIVCLQEVEALRGVMPRKVADWPSSIRPNAIRR
jgi:mRNA deadenylase 3'-5' endonuclease subunit Ccr4